MNAGSLPHDPNTLKEEGVAAGAWSGKKLGDYEIRSSLGRDNMGQTYMATACSTGATVAVKVLRPELAEDPEWASRFLALGPRATQLDHPSLIKYLEFSQEAGCLYFAMEFFKGRTAQTLLETHGRVNLFQTLDFGICACQAIGHAAMKGACHQDLRPMNLMVSETGEIKIVGLGMADIQKGPPRGGATNPILMGDPHYMPPEQSMGQAIDYRSDLYALGATLYHLLTGRAPFDGPILVVLTRHKIEARPDPRAWDVTIPQELARLIRSLMAVEVEHRPADAARVEAQLREIKQKLLEARQAPQSAKKGNRSTIRRRSSNTSLLRDSLAKMGTASSIRTMGATTRRLRTTRDAATQTSTPPSSAKKVWMAGLLSILVLGAIMAAFLLPTQGHESAPSKVKKGAEDQTPTSVNLDRLEARLRKGDVPDVFPAGQVPTFQSVSELKMPDPETPLKLYCLLYAQLDAKTEAAWKAAGLLAEEQTVLSPFLRTVTVKRGEDMEMLLDWHVEKVALRPSSVRASPSPSSGAATGSR